VHAWPSAKRSGESRAPKQRKSRFSALKLRGEEAVLPPRRARNDYSWFHIPKGISIGALRGLFSSDASNAIIDDMAALTIRQLDQKTKTRLRVRAAHHGRSMEEEAREILRSALTTSSRTKGNLAEAIRRRFASFGGIEISLPQRDAVRKAPGFEE
jgi:plasmid stability protein